MRQQTILVVDDEPTIREVVRKYLERDGFAVQEAADGHQALIYLRANTPDLIVLDVMLPGVDGITLTRQLRDPAGYASLSVDGNIPIIMLTAKTEELHRILGFEVGADDYVTKPFSPQEIVARVKAVLRRASGTAVTPIEKPISFDNLRIDPRTHSVSVGDKENIALTAKEFDLLWFLARHPRQVFTRTQLLDQVWGFEFYGDDSTVTVHVRRLREKIEPDPANPIYVQTVWGVGYKFEA
ncbi:MAG: response regulator transcription factor [Anaerolineae bacterium]|nr:response regulator transcription factor [Anaerolineae bacterium]